MRRTSVPRMLDGTPLMSRPYYATVAAKRQSNDAWGRDAQNVTAGDVTSQGVRLERTPTDQTEVLCYSLQLQWHSLMALQFQ